jgi:hypothetical protein
MRASILPMMATLAPRLPAGPNWSGEVKWDGYRSLLFRDNARARLISRNLRDPTRITRRSRRRLPRRRGSSSSSMAKSWRGTRLAGLVSGPAEPSDGRRQARVLRVRPLALGRSSLSRCTLPRLFACGIERSPGQALEARPLVLKEPRRKTGELLYDFNGLSGWYARFRVVLARGLRVLTATPQGNQRK